MKKYVKKLLALGLSAVIFAGSVPAEYVHAAEVQEMAASDANVQNEETTEQDTELKAALLNYVYVEKPYLETPDIQNMYVSIGEEEIGIDSAKLELENCDTGDKLVLDAKEIIGNRILFSKDFKEEQKGIYQVTGVEIAKGDDAEKIDLVSIGMQIYFGVNEKINMEPQMFSEDSFELDSYIVTIEEDGSTEAAESIEEALQSVNSRNAKIGRTGNAVVMLDPGHDDTHKGAHQSGLEEEKLNLKIGLYCKAELEEYSGVTVYMTRGTNACPYPGTTSSDCNKARVQDAADKGADIYVALHLNSFENSSASGAVVYCPNKNYNPSVGAEGRELAEKISRELAELGLNDRGVTIRNSEDQTLYPDGSLADYYGIIKNSKLQGIPAIIVEHAFMTNASDVNNFLTTEAGLKKLGVADATGIAEYFGLAKGIPSAAKVTATANASESRFALTAHQVQNAQSVRFAVWSEKGGQDDLKWYQASNNGNGNWTAEAVISNHKSTGIYNVHTYAKNGYGPEKYIGGTTFNVSSASVEKVFVENIDSENGRFDIILQKVTGAGIKKIEVAVWSQKDQSDLKWYTAQSLENGNYRVKADIANHNYNYGQYYIDAYIVGESGARSYGGGTKVTISAPKSKITAESNKTETEVALTARNVTISGGVKSVRFAVWSEKGGQDDLIWYDGLLQGGGTWSVNALISRHKTAGKYYVDAYGTGTDGKKTYLGGTNFMISSDMGIQNVTAGSLNPEAGTFTVSLEGIHSISGISNLRMAVWSRSDQSDLKWYNVSAGSDGSANVLVNVANHNYNYGKYYADVYLTGGNGIKIYAGGTTAEMPLPKSMVTAQTDAMEKSAAIVARGVNISGGVKSVRFAVWSEKGGQDDLVWYDGQHQGGGTWSADARISNHKTAGKYYVDAYGIGVNGKKIYVGGTKFEISSNLGVQSVTAGSLKPEDGTFTVNLEGIHSVSGISSLKAAVWSQSNQSDLKWYSVSAGSDGKAQILVDLANHNYNYGKYYVDVYMTGGNGIKVYAGGTTAQMSLPKAAVTTKTDAMEKVTAITAKGVALPGGVENVRFAVWSEKGGQDDLVWYQGNPQGTGVWSVYVDTANHKTAGKYFVHVYAKGKNGANTAVGTSDFSISAPALESVTADYLNPAAGTFRINLNGIHSVSGVSKLQVAVWSRSDQKDLKWYTEEDFTAESYKVNINIANHNYNYGKYYADVYLTSGNGIRKYAGGTTINLPVPKAEVTVEKNSAETKAIITAENVAVSGGVSAVRFAVWSQTKGQDDLIWYEAVSNGKGAWVATVDITRHKTAGLYYADTYVISKNGTKHCAGGKTFTVSDAAALSVSVVDVKEAAGKFSVKASGVTAPSGIKSVQAAVWSTDDQSDLVWYNARNIGNNTYVADADIRNHKNNIGTYQIHVYVTAGNGVRNAVGTATCKIVNVDGVFYPIMGKSTVTADQLVQYYNRNQKYPSFYASTDAPGIREFCQIYIEECAAEGVKAEVAFAQAMMETGYLQFGGDVKIEQFNFAGIGATGNGVPGHSFKNVRTGVRAHVQHLKAYASKEPLKNSCVDPRFQYVKRGTAPYVEWLGIQENPNGAGWAASKNYGINMLNNYIKKIKSI